MTMSLWHAYPIPDYDKDLALYACMSLLRLVCNSSKTAALGLDNFYMSNIRIILTLVEEVFLFKLVLESF